MRAKIWASSHKAAVVFLAVGVVWTAIGFMWHPSAMPFELLRLFGAVFVIIGIFAGFVG